MLIYSLPISNLICGQANKNGETSKKIGTIVLQPKKQNSNRPNIPIKYIIECSYGEGWLCLSIPQQIGNNVSICLQDETNTLWYGIATTEQPFCEIPVLEGSYTIVCTTMMGTEFIGTLDF